MNGRASSCDIASTVTWRSCMHSSELALDRARERAGERGLADARVVLHEHVALRQQRHDRVAELLVADLHRAADVLRDPLRHRDGGRHLGGGEALVRLGGGFDGLHGQRGTFSGVDERSLKTMSRMAPATSAFAAFGTGWSPSAVTITTSLSALSKPIEGSETSLSTTASRPLRSSLERACASAPSPCSAAKPISTWPGRRASASAESTSVVRTSWRWSSPTASFLSLPACGSAGR